MSLRGLLTRMRKPSQPMGRAQFQSFVLSTLARHLPGEHYEARSDPDSISHGEVVLGLQNLYAIYLRDSLSQTDLVEMVLEHFQRHRDLVGHGTSGEVPPIDTVRVRLRPQLMPVEYAEQIPVFFIPLHPDFHIGIVIDQEQGYGYVRQEDASEWALPSQELLDLAIANLDEASRGMAISSSQGPERFLGVELKDGYDAARILLPGLRAFAAEQLGEPFYVAVPNRDFLFLWSTSCSPAFHSFARQKIAKDFRAQPYALTGDILQADRSGIRPATLE